MIKTESRPDIFDFQNHLDYAQAIFHFKRKSVKTFSYAFCARKMKVSSGYLKNVFTRRRKLGLNLVSNFSKTFGLSSREKRYLSILVVKDEITDSETKNYFDGILATLRARAQEFSNDTFFSDLLGDEQTLKDRLTHLLLSMIKLEGFSEDPKWIKSRISPALRVKTHHIETRLRNLIDQKVVDFNQGQYRVLNECLSSPNPYDPESFKIYRAGLRQVDQALEEISSYKPCNFFMGNLTIDAGLEREALDIFNRCRDQLLELEKKSHHPAKVLAISNNLITLVK